MDDDCDNFTISIDKHGSLYFLLSGFLGALNKGTETWQRSYDRRTLVIAAQNKESADLDQLKALIDEADKKLNTGQ